MLHRHAIDVLESVKEAVSLWTQRKTLESSYNLFTPAGHTGTFPPNPDAWMTGPSNVLYPNRLPALGTRPYRPSIACWRRKTERQRLISRNAAFPRSWTENIDRLVTLLKEVSGRPEDAVQRRVLDRLVLRGACGSWP